MNTLHKQITKPKRTRATPVATEDNVLALPGMDERSGTGAVGPISTIVPDQEGGVPSIPDWITYQRDFFERSVLFFDTLRERAAVIRDHERAGMPPLLDFKYETLLDARRFDRPANYALLRITEIDGDCWDDCVDHSKPPVIVVDPRAGHGPGIGGFKRDSEVGMAMREGHPVYFVVFFPEPVRQQSLMDVLAALRAFVEEVARRHQGTPPVLYGNCQAGWAIALLSADCEGLVGPAVLNGAPLSYWAGESGVNPMRISGGLLGGSWLAHLTADLGDGRFDGAWLAQNFENLKPEKAIWEKYTHLFENVDTERERFLEFERWWNGFYSLSREEFLTIVENLFVGNKLEKGLMPIGQGCVADLKRIKNPLVIFTSFGDNITPPQQALGWVPAVYPSTDALKEAGQRIIYLTNPHVGHLGIFVSASVARLEHRAILESLDEIEALAPGLYEMKIENPTGDPDCHKPQYMVQFEPRNVEDLAQPYPSIAFERVEQVSVLNESLYKNFLSPWVQAFSNPFTADLLKAVHPMRMARYAFSDEFNPWMKLIGVMADSVAANRHPLGRDGALLQAERNYFSEGTTQLERLRETRDAMLEGSFKVLFQWPELLSDLPTTSFRATSEKQGQHG